jgi:xanthine dehydrogenase accessory factor
VIVESEQVLASFQPRLLQMNLDDEDAWELGFSCAGSLDVLIEPVDLDTSDNLLNLYRAVSEILQQGKCAVLGTPLKDTRFKLLVFEDGRYSGTLGNSNLDREAVQIALELIPKRSSATVSLQTASAPIEVFFEVHGPPPTLIVFGAGHVAMPLIKLGHDIGLRTIVVDGRPRFATKERFPDVDQLLIGIPSEIAETLTYTASTFVVLTAHDYKYDLPVLKTVLPSAAGYIGLLGSRRRGEAITRFLIESGMEQRLLARLHVPTGLNIGAETASEIALSILAEAVAVKAGRRGEPLRERK